MDNNIFEQLKKEIPGIKENVPLKNYTTFSLGGPAEYFLIASKSAEIIQAVKTAKKLKLPVFLFGGGSNLLVSDNGLKGLVIKIENKEGIMVKENNILEAPAGISMKDLIDFSVLHSLEGLEWAGGLPGTFGGAIRGNAGCFGQEMKDSILEVLAVDSYGTLKKLNHKQCRFSYRSSIFKEKNWMVLSASVQLRPGDKKNLQNIVASHIDHRNRTQPLELPNAGSIFKNCDLKLFSKKWQTALAHKVKKDPFPVVPTAHLIFEAGLMGTKVGNAQISSKHTNFIVNLGGAKAEDVLDLIKVVKKKIKVKYGIMLEVEVQYIK